MDETSDTLPEVYEIDSLEQMRAVSDELRLRIMDLLARRAMTVTQVGEALGVAPAKAHYHVRELERVGLVDLVETREKGGILEKYYRAVARDFRVSDSLLQRTPPDETLGALNEFLQFVTRGFLDAVARDLRSGTLGTEANGIFGVALWMTDEEAKAFWKRMEELARPYEDPRGIPGERLHVFTRIGYVVADEGDQQPQAPDTPIAVRAPRPVHAPRPAARPKARHHRAFTAGFVSYSREDFERVVAQGGVLDVYALGACTIAEDVPAELVDRAVARFRLRGTLTASPEVRAVLERKQKAKKEG
ncbi:MAG TPA: helix-turn-helix domain-containing protein [Ktedonobacterales bacterium]|nr:helix-turn-helix domain-containing protein [Ktedonobacterales bacterium]